MAGKYTEAQHKATTNYRADKTFLSLTLTKEEKKMIEEKAKRSDLSIKQYVVQLIEKDN